LYTLFNHPHIFNKYVLTSPALGWDNGITYTYEKNYASSDSQLPAKLYVAFGEKEGGVEAFNKFVNVLEQRDYKSLEFSTKILEGIGHSGTKAEGYTRGLQFVFSRPSLKLSNEILDEYTGIYEMSNKMKITVEKENGDLIVIVPFDGNIKLEAESENKFYIKGQFLKVLFQKDENKNVTGFELQRYDRTQFGIKIK
ncbi:MAG: hypothetical protein OQJ81_05605, partial [Melioribacteraceae bacterium]|nr:hypothetical protein [Melioribacteraceae bacterium]